VYPDPRTQPNYFQGVWLIGIKEDFLSSTLVSRLLVTSLTSSASVLTIAIVSFRLKLSFGIRGVFTMRWLVLCVAAAAFQTLPLMATAVNANITEIHESQVPTESYFREHTASNLLSTHILFMILSWVGALPICLLHSFCPYIP